MAESKEVIRVPGAFHYRANEMCKDAGALNRDVLILLAEKTPHNFSMIRGADGPRSWCEKCEGQLI